MLYITSVMEMFAVVLHRKHSKELSPCLCDILAFPQQLLKRILVQSRLLATICSLQAPGWYNIWNLNLSSWNPEGPLIPHAEYPNANVRTEVQSWKAWKEEKSPHNSILMRSYTAGTLGISHTKGNSDLKRWPTGPWLNTVKDGESFKYRSHCHRPHPQAEAERREAS